MISAVLDESGDIWILDGDGKYVPATNPDTTTMRFSLEELDNRVGPLARVQRGSTVDVRKPLPNGSEVGILCPYPLDGNIISSRTDTSGRFVYTLQLEVHEEYVR